MRHLKSFEGSRWIVCFWSLILLHACQAPENTVTQCGSDLDCRHDRICVDGTCTTSPILGGADTTTQPDGDADRAEEDMNRQRDALLHDVGSTEDAGDDVDAGDGMSNGPPPNWPSCVIVTGDMTFEPLTVGQESYIWGEEGYIYIKNDCLEAVEVTFVLSPSDVFSKSPEIDTYPIEVGQRGGWRVTFQPDSPSQFSVEGTLSLHKGLGEHVADWVLRFEGEGRSCPTPVFKRPPPASDLEPVLFDGSESVAATGRTITGYTWRVITGPGNPAFDPSAEVAAPLVSFPVLGDYEVELTVLDSAGEVSCEPATQEIAVSWYPPADIGALLTWVKVPAGQMGADLDLHYKHPNGEWGVGPWCVFYDSVDQYWDSPSERVSLVAASVDGGPETIFHRDAQPNLVYSVGAHYYPTIDNPGPTDARTRVASGAVVQDFHKTLSPGEFWHVADVSRNGTITTIDTVTDGFPP